MRGDNFTSFPASFPGKDSNEHGTTGLVLEDAASEQRPLLLRAAGDRPAPSGDELRRLLGVHGGAQRNARNARAARQPRLDRHRTRHRQLRAPLCHVLVLESIPVIGLFPSLAPRSLKRAQQAPKRIIIATRACQVAGRPANELWRFDGDITSTDPMVSNAFMDAALRDLAIALHKQGTLLGTPKRLFGGALPKDHLFYLQNTAIMRRDAKMNKHY